MFVETWMGSFRWRTRQNKRLSVQFSFRTQDMWKESTLYRKAHPLTPFSYPEPFLRAANGARRGALAKSISNWHLIGYNEGYCSNTGYILLPCFYGIRLWIWPEPLVAPRVRRALGTRIPLTPTLSNNPHWWMSPQTPALVCSGALLRAPSLISPSEFSAQVVLQSGNIHTSGIYDIDMSYKVQLRLHI